MKEAGDDGSDGAADLNDRPLPATRSTATKGESRRHDLGRNHSPRDSAISHAQGRDHVRYSVALNLGGEAPCHPPGDQEPQRHRDQDPPPLPTDQLLERVEAFGDAVDHQDQGGRADPDANPDQCRQSQEASGIAVGDDIDGGELTPATVKVLTEEP